MNGLTLPILGVLTLIVVVISVNEYTGVNDSMRERRAHMFEDKNGNKYNPFSDIDPENHDDTTCPHCGTDQIDDGFSYCGECGGMI